MADLPAVLLGAFFVTVGLSHFVWPGYFRSLVPAWMPAPAALVAVTGAAEIVAGVLVLVPATRVVGAWVAVGLVSVYMVGHFDAVRTMRRDTRFLDRPTGVAARIVVNFGYIGWAVWVAVRAGA